jgi:hypothetical protein
MNESKSEDEAAVISSVMKDQLLGQFFNFAAECDRWRISDRAAAALSSALLQDSGYITQNDKSCVLDRSKMRRKRHFLLGKI